MTSQKPTQPGKNAGRRAVDVEPSASSDHSQEACLVPNIERALAASVFSNPGFLIRMISPLWVHALRLTLHEWLRNTLERLNYRVLRTVSMRGLSWRWAAFRKGITFDEILTEQEVLGRVEQVFLIHRETGLLLAEARMDGKAMRNGDMVSGMLTAIQDFVHDSFGVRAGERLDGIQVGSVRVWIEQGSQAVLAAVVRGRQPDHLQAGCRAVLDRIHVEWATPLKTFDGDTSLFRHTRRYLSECLVAAEGRVQGRILPATWMVLAAPVLALAMWIYASMADRMRWEACLQQIEARPGLIITEARRKGGEFRIQGLRDPLAADPIDIFVMSGIDADKVVSTWQPYQAIHTEFQLIRIRRILNPPATVALNLTGDTLSASGHAGGDWIRSAKTLARGFAGVTRFDTSRLLDVEAAENKRWKEYLQVLSQMPGVIVASDGRRDGGFFVEGLRDPLADDPAAVLGQFGFAAADVNSSWHPYELLEPEFILKRALRRLEPPQSITLTVEGDTLAASGAAQHAWIDQAKMKAMGIGGIDKFDTTNLKDLDIEQVKEIQARIEGRVFRFLPTTPDLWPGQATMIARLARDIDDLKQYAATVNRRIVIEVRGHTDASGNAEADFVSSTAMATRFVDVLSSRSVDSTLLRSKGMGAALLEGLIKTDESHNRYVSLKVLLFPPL